MPLTLRRVLFPVVLGYTAFLALLSQLLPTDTVIALFSEEGPFEILSVVLWLCAAFLALCCRRFSVPSRLALCLASITLAVREAGLPPWLVPSGKRLISLGYYLDPSVAPLTRVISAVVIIAVVLSILGSAVTVLRFLAQDRGWARVEGHLLLWAGALLAFSQIFDGLELSSQQLTQLCLAFEEGFEMLSPLFVTIAFALIARFLVGSRPEPGAVDENAHAARPE